MTSSDRYFALTTLGFLEKLRREDAKFRIERPAAGYTETPKPLTKRQKRRLRGKGKS